MKKIILPLALFFFFQNSFTLQAQWTELGSGITVTPRQVWGIHVVNENVIWAITGFNHTNFTPAFEFTKTTDGGATWEPGILDFAPQYYHFDIFALNDSVAWVTAADEQDPIAGVVYKTIDGGISWIEQSSGFTEFNETPAGLHFWNMDKGIAFGATCSQNYDDQIAIYTTTDGGDNWEKITGDSMPAQLPGEGICWVTGNSNYDVVGDTIWFISSKNRVFSSYDTGFTWEVYDISLENGSPLSIAFKDALNGIVVGANPNDPNSASRTTDGGKTWESLPIPNEIEAGQIEFIPNTAGTYIVHNAGIPQPNPNMLITYDDGSTWDTLQSNVNLVCIEFLSPTLGFGGGLINSATSGGIYKWDNPLLDSEDIMKDAPFLKLYPNPTSDYLNFSFSHVNQSIELSLYNWQGKLIRKKKITADQSVNVRDLEKGIYFLNAVVEGQPIYIQRFVKQ